MTFINLYCPPGYSPSFLASTFAMFADFASADSFVGGDFNCHIDPFLDKRPSSSPPSSQARMLTSLSSDFGFCLGAATPYRLRIYIFLLAP